MEVVIQVADRIFSYSRQDSPEALPGLGRQVFLLDGSSLTFPRYTGIAQILPALSE